MEKKFDVVIIGGGPAGYVCAIRCAQLGLKTVCIDKRKTLGGTCLNVGCIPSKALLQSSHLYAQARHDFEKHGINVKEMSVNVSVMQKRKTTLVDELTKGIDFLFKKNKIERVIGVAKITGKNKVEVQDESGTQTLETKNIIIATGSEATSVPGIEIDEKTIVSSTGALELEKAPEHLVVIGGGYIGLEMGSVWQRLGAKVTVVEFFERIVPAMDIEVSTALQKMLEKQGMEFKLQTKVTSVKKENGDMILKLEPASGGTASELSCDVLLVSTGRKPYTEGLGLDSVGVVLDDRGLIQVDASYQTTVEGIYAVGDVIAGPMLAHKGEEEGIAVAEVIAGHKSHVNYATIPGVVYTHPEVATVGLTEEQLKEQDIAYRVGKFPFLANSRAKANGDTEGFVKILVDAKTDRILGAHIIGPEAGTLIAEIVLGMEYDATSEDIGITCHAHPTLNEAVKEAALDALGRVIHK